MHFLLYSIAQHKCSLFNINFDLQKRNINDLVLLLTPYINQLRKSCINCKLYDGYITIAEIAHLLVLNKRNQFTTAVDISVYSKHQQFRLFDCVKRGQMNPLTQCSNFPFDNHVQHSCWEILEKSLITHTQQSNLPIVYIKDNQFKSKNMSIINLLEIAHNTLLNLKHINEHFSNFSALNSKSISNEASCNLNTELKTTHSSTNCNNDIQLYREFVENLIKQDRNHQGYIRSCVRGTYNADMLFFNIGGQYRYCEKKGAHHERNTTAILINTKTDTYTIRCKDPNCDNTCLIWKKIE